MPNCTQGPFKPPERVLKIRNRPLRPTLRVATDYNAAATLEYDLALLMRIDGYQGGGAPR